MIFHRIFNDDFIKNLNGFVCLSFSSKTQYIIHLLILSYFNLSSK